MGFRRTARLGVGLLLASAGCFASPPSSTSGSEGSSSGETAGPGVTGDSLTTSASQTTGISGTDSSSSVTSSSDSSNSSTGSESTATETTSPGDTSTTEVGCPDEATEIDGTCLIPLSVIDTISAMGELTSYTDDCITQGCPGGGLPLAAAFEVENVSLTTLAPDVASSSAQVCGTEEMASPNRWAAGVQCAVGEGDTLSVLEVHELANSDSDCLESVCPVGTSLVGGGARWTGPFALRGSRPLGSDRWEVCGEAYGDVEVETEALCAVLPDGASTAVFAETVSVPASGSTACVSASCPAGMLLAGGGRMALGSGLYRSAPDPDGEDAWQACGFNGTGFSIEVESQVLCLQN